MTLWSCGDGQFTQPHFFLGSCCGISRGGGGEYSNILLLYVGSDHFLGFKTLNFNTFGVFHTKNEYFWRGVWRNCWYLLGPLQIGLFRGSFLYILGLFKFKVQNGNIFFFWGGGGGVGSQNFKCLFFPFFGGVCLIFLFWGAGGINNRCWV